jgi:hypothetical protein
MTATTLLGGHNTAIGTPTRLRTILKLGKSGTPGITYKRARTRPAAGSRISSTTTIDLATWTYYKVSYIIRTGAVKTAQDRVCAHGVDRGVGSYQRPGEGWRPPEHAPDTAIHPMLSGGPGAARWPCHCSLRAVHCSPFEQDRHRCTPANAKEEKGQWDVGACACCERATIASPADRVRLVSQKEIICGCLGVPRVCAHVPASNSLSLLIHCLR